MTETPFCGLRLLTLPGEVMSPRPSTEALVDAAAERIGNRPALVADVGTGSGAIAVALALARRRRGSGRRTRARARSRSRAQTSVGISSASISVQRADLLESIPGDLDLGAVFAPGDGLGPYRRLVEECAKALRPHGALAIQLHRRVLVAEASRLSDLRLAVSVRS